MTFDPKKLIKTAEYLSLLNNDEETVRSMINRAYYAAFGTAKRKLKIKKSDNIHAIVIQTLKASENRKFQYAGNVLESLRKNRVLADYDYDSIIRQSAYQNVINDANYVIENLIHDEVSS